MGLAEDLRKPVTIISLSLAILGIILSVVFYFKSTRERLPTYLITSPATKIFSSEEESPKFKVIAKDDEGKEDVIRTDIYVQTVTFWNSGQLPIEKADVRVPVRFIIKNGERLLDASITARTEPDVAKLRLLAKQETESGIAIPIDWDHFDPGEGIQFKVIYTAEKPATFDFDGKIVGVDRFLDGRALGQRYEFVGAIQIFATILLLGGWLSLRQRFGLEPLQWNARHIISEIGAASPFLLVACLIFWLLSGESPPF